MSEFVMKKDYWTLLVVFAGILIVAGIISVAGPFVENIGATDTANPSGTGTGGDGAGIDGAATETRTPERNSEENVVSVETVGEIGKYYPITNLPQEISSEKRPDMNLVNVRIENNILKFSIVKNDDEKFSNVRYHAVNYDVKVVAYRGEPYNREITYSFLSDRLRLERWQKENIEGDLSLLELQSADYSSGKLQKTSCEIRQIMFYFE